MHDGPSCQMTFLGIAKKWSDVQGRDRPGIATGALYGTPGKQHDQHLSCGKAPHELRSCNVSRVRTGVISTVIWVTPRREMTESADREPIAAVFLTVVTHFKELK